MPPARSVMKVMKGLSLEHPWSCWGMEREQKKELTLEGSGDGTAYRGEFV